MAPFYLVLALLIQCSFLHADNDVPEDKEELREILQKPDTDDLVKEPMPMPNWFNMFVMPNTSSPFLFPSSSASMMAQITTANKTIEEQLHDIKELAKQISDLLEKEMVSLFSDVISNEKETDDNGVRKRRSAETPLDSSKMVMRLLKHIKSNNEYQNIAIDKMMSAQEIAEKYGIEFSPDPEILSELALAASEHAHEMTSMLHDACSLNNVTLDKVEFVPALEEPRPSSASDYYSYATERSEPSFEYLPEIVTKPKPAAHVHSAPRPAPHHHHPAPVSPKPSFYESFMYPYSPACDYYATYSAEPVLLIPIEEPEPEPELVGEVVEETVTTRLVVEKGEQPGSTSVNHVTTYTVAEKSIFKPPQQELPQHFQYCFLLM